MSAGPEAGARPRGPGWRPDAEVQAFVDAALAEVLGHGDKPPHGALRRVYRAGVARFGVDRAMRESGVHGRLHHVLRARAEAEHAAKLAAIMERAAALRASIDATARALAEHPAPTTAEFLSLLDTAHGGEGATAARWRRRRHAE